MKLLTTKELRLVAHEYKKNPEHLKSIKAGHYLALMEATALAQMLKDSERTKLEIIEEGK